jgi:hypothetical protein
MRAPEPSRLDLPSAQRAADEMRRSSVIASRAAPAPELIEPLAGMLQVAADLIEASCDVMAQQERSLRALRRELERRERPWWARFGRMR